MSSSLDEFVKTVQNDDVKILKKEIPNNCYLSIEKVAYPYENLKRIES